MTGQIPMSTADYHVRIESAGAQWMRVDTAQILKQFFCNRSLAICRAAWIALLAPLEIKTGLANQ